MGLLNLFAKDAPRLLLLPSGSFTVDRTGRVVSDTIPSAFPSELVSAVADEVLATFREATEAQLPLSELVLDYPSLRIVAREMRGGALIFFAPKAAAVSTASLN